MNIREKDKEDEMKSGREENMRLKETGIKIEISKNRQGRRGM